MAEGVANKEQAEKCLVIAREALAAGNIEKASRFGEKSMKLYPHDEVCSLQPEKQLQLCKLPAWSPDLQLSTCALLASAWSASGSLTQLLGCRHAR